MFGTLSRWGSHNAPHTHFDVYFQLSSCPSGRWIRTNTLGQLNHSRKYSDAKVYTQSSSSTRRRSYSGKGFTNSKTLQRLSEIYDVESLLSYLQELPTSPLNAFLKQCIQHNFHVSNNLRLSFQKRQESEASKRLLDWAYIYQFRFNQSQTDILEYNASWKKMYNKQMLPVYNSSYICWLLNTSQGQIASVYVIKFLKESEIPLSLAIKVLLENQDMKRLEFVFELFHDKTINLEDYLWLRVLQVGLENNSYQIVKEVYTRYIMAGFSNGKITLEEAVLSLMPESNRIFESLTNSLLMNVLQVLAMHGDTTSTMDLIESHFFHKVVAGGSALNKELCIRILESHCYNAENGGTSLEEILDLLDVFATKEVKGGIESTDLFQAMNHKFANFGSVTDSDDSNSDVVSLRDKSDKLSLAKLGTLYDYTVQSMEYAQRLHPRTKSIFIDCLLNYVATYLNHTAVVQTLMALHYANPASIKELSTSSLNSILYSLSKSSSKRCALHYLKYLKSIGITPSHQMYSWMIRCTMREHYEFPVLYFLWQYYQDHAVLQGPMKQTFNYLPSNGLFGELKSQLIEGNNIAAAFELLCNELSEDRIFAKTGPTVHGKYNESHDLKDLAKLERILPIQ
ncbi:hypothetical protein I9W82_000552 [Candida metapsilosis]|uniref:Uncharacterized protein n=1 Tax=Candida metapsilosis TaxID=273372 RepID=A0A8H8DEI7_9ASCO|nr:hypothetical protein I9W82_000552 [Candida metapsilosis]